MDTSGVPPSCQCPLYVVLNNVGRHDRCDDMMIISSRVHGFRASYWTIINSLSHVGPIALNDMFRRRVNASI